MQTPYIQTSSVKFAGSTRYLLLRRFIPTTIYSEEQYAALAYGADLLVANTTSEASLALLEPLMTARTNELITTVNTLRAEILSKVDIVAIAALPNPSSFQRKLLKSMYIIPHTHSGLIQMKNAFKQTLRQLK